MVRIIPSRLKSSYGHNTSAQGSRNTSPSPNMHKRDVSPNNPATKAIGLMLRTVVLRVRTGRDDVDLVQRLTLKDTGQKSCGEGQERDF